MTVTDAIYEVYQHYRSKTRNEEVAGLLTVAWAIKEMEITLLDEQPTETPPKCSNPSPQPQKSNS